VNLTHILPLDFLKNKKGVKQVIFITSKKLKKIAEKNGIYFSAKKIAEKNGILISDADLPKLRLLNIETVRDGMPDGVRRLSRYEIEPRICKFLSYNGYDSSEFKDSIKNIFQELGDKLDLDVEIMVPHGDPKLPLLNGKLSIMIYSSPEVDCITSTSKDSLLGITLPNRDYCKVSGKYYTVFEEGIPLLEVYDRNNFYIALDLVHNNSDNSLKFIQIIADKIYDIVSDDDIMKEILKKSQKVSLDKFILLSRRSFDEEIKILQKKIDQNTIIIAEMKNRILDCVRQNTVRDKKIQGLQQFDDSKIVEQFEMLMTNDMCKNLIVGDNKIVYSTSMIYIEEKGKRYMIGEFSITVDFADGGILFYNKTNQGKGVGSNPPPEFDGNTTYNRHHPHIKENGKACLGNISEMLGQLIAKYEINTIFLLLVEWLESVNVDDTAGKGIYWWPEATEKGE